MKDGPSIRHRMMEHGPACMIPDMEYLAGLYSMSQGDHIPPYPREGVRYGLSQMHDPYWPWDVSLGAHPWGMGCYSMGHNKYYESQRYRPYHMPGVDK
jgi:hypothetical protein